MKKQEGKVIIKGHKKHSSLVKPLFGNFGRNEFSLVGAKCGDIEDFVKRIFSVLSLNYNCGYIGAFHTKDDSDETEDELLGGFLKYTSHSNYSEITTKTQVGRFQNYSLFNETDFILVNGNHHQTTAQIVVIDEDKKESLKKRLPHLTNVQLFLLTNNSTEIFDFIKESVPEWNSLPIYRIEETDKIASFFNEKLMHATPAVNGLVLAGGKSVRMGYDKTTIDWHGKEQRYYIYDLLKNICTDVFISCRHEQIIDILPEYNTLPDNFLDLGPYGAILSAFQKNPNSAWLVLATDLPLLDKETLQYLLQNRNPKAIATTFESPDGNFPEPLITIWEPKSYPILLNFLSQGVSCPKKVLINNNTHVLKLKNTNISFNINTPQEAEKMKEIIKNG